MFLDEFGTSFRERLGTTWAPRGQRPILKRTDADRRALATLAALTISGKIYTRHIDGSIASPHVITMLKGLLTFLPEGFVLVWDGTSIHRSQLTRRFLSHHPEIAVEPLPPYAPELNAEEYSHGNVKCQAPSAQRHTRRQSPDASTTESRVQPAASSPRPALGLLPRCPSDCQATMVK